MLERLEAERREGASLALAAQERERARIALDLHDEVNQSLTGVLLRLETMRRTAPEEIRDELAETREVAAQAMEELLALAHRLRPTSLDDLGLRAAIAGLVEENGRRTGIETTFEFEGDVHGLSPDVQLVTYRVAQEALSNAVQHSGASHIRVRLIRVNGELELRVSDDGSGFDVSDAARRARHRRDARARAPRRRRPRCRIRPRSGDAGKAPHRRLPMRGEMTTPAEAPTRCAS